MIVLSRIKHECNSWDATQNLTALCFHPDHFAKIKDLFDQFLSKHLQFNDCLEWQDYSDSRPSTLTCRIKNGDLYEGGKGWGRLIFSTEDNSDRFSLFITHTSHDNPTYGFTCEINSATKSPVCKGTGYMANYELKWNPQCQELVRHRTAGRRQTDYWSTRLCEDKLVLFPEGLEKAQKAQEILKKKVIVLTPDSDAAEKKHPETKNTMPPNLATPTSNPPQSGAPNNPPPSPTPDSDAQDWSTAMKLAGIGVGIGVLGLGLYARHRSNRDELQKQKNIQSTRTK